MGWQAPAFYASWCEGFGDFAQLDEKRKKARHPLPKDLNELIDHKLNSRWAPMCLWLYPPPPAETSPPP